MNSLFPENEIKLEDLFLEIKYDGSSFDGVMNIQDLGNELLGIEYCLKIIINDLVETNKELSKADIDSLQILTEGFVNNCFKKKIKFFLSDVSKNLENLPIVKSFLKSTIDVYLSTQSIQSTLDSDNTQVMLQSSQLPIEQHRKIKNLPISDNAQKIIESNLLDKKYREASAKTIMPLKNDNDNLETSSPVLENSVIIDNSNKESFLVVDSPQEQEEDVIDEDKTIKGRISSINLDATKNQIGFKENNEGIEIRCHLPGNLDINDYKYDYLGEWVEITGKVSCVGKIIKKIDISKLKKSFKSGQVNLYD
jgi:hypothetical protein